MNSNTIELKSGVGLVIANRIGSDVLIRAGFISQNMSANNTASVLR